MLFTLRMNITKQKKISWKLKKNDVDAVFFHEKVKTKKSLKKFNKGFGSKTTG